MRCDAAISPCAGGELYVGTDIDVIRKRAVSLYETVNAIYGEQVVFPDLKFDCPGNITSIWFVARENSSGSMFSEFPDWFQVWRVTVTGDNTFQGALRGHRAATEANLIAGGADVGLYQLTLPEPLQFEAGDVFGINHSALSNLLVQYQEGGGVRTFWLFDSETFQQYTQYRYPLVALGGECTSFCLKIKIINL